jgi:hypothetical protein
MKTNILGLTVLSVLFTVQGFAQGKQKVQVSGFRKATVVINLETSKPSGDGSFKDTVVKVCEGEITSPIYEYTDLSKDYEIAPSNVNLKRCAINIKGVEAEVVLNTFVFKFPSQFMKSESKLSEIPKWLAPHVQVGSKSSAYSAYLQLIPKGFDPTKLMGSQEYQLSPEEMSVFGKIGEITDTNISASSVSILGKSSNPVILSHTISTSRDYCNKNWQEEYCSLNTRITANIIFEGK